MLSWRVTEHPAGNGAQIIEILKNGVAIAYIAMAERAIKVVSEFLGEIDFDRLHPPCLTINFEDHSACH